MNKIKSFLKRTLQLIIANRRGLLLSFIILSLLGLLMLRQIVTLPGGMSAAERVVSTTPVGWHGIISDPFYLIVKFIRSIGFYWFEQGGILVSRLPSVIMGAIAIICLAAVIKVWHGSRIAVFAAVLFATSAWTLHVSRYASYDSSYLVAIPLLLTTQLILQRSKSYWAAIAVLLIWSTLLFTPGLVWFVLLAAFWQRYDLLDVWQKFRSWKRRTILIISSLAWSPLLIYHLTSSSQALLAWIGLPVNFGTVLDFGQRLGEVLLNLFIIGPDQPELWLGRLPVLDLITLVFAILGMVFYVRKWRAGRSQLLAAYGLLAIVSIGLGGPVGFSLIVPLAYLLAATGMAQLLNDWLKRFPNNPLARSFGILLIAAAVTTSSVHNLRSYFVAWPANAATIQKFDDRP